MQGKFFPPYQKNVQINYTNAEKFSRYFAQTHGIVHETTTQIMLTVMYSPYMPDIWLCVV